MPSWKPSTTPRLVPKRTATKPTIMSVPAWYASNMHQLKMFPDMFGACARAAGKEIQPQSKSAMQQNWAGNRFIRVSIERS